ncbi:MAG: DUF4270 domain-containing protein [Bacteroidales bacterium]|jgi:hypothetical protein|nr:DUF4270 domain-containing protein [Bacteroidales bacterium]
MLNLFMKRGASIIILLFVVLFLAFSCRKDPSKIGLEVNPESDNLDLGIDTMVFFASYTVEYDTISTTNSSGLLLGSIDDPIFGKTQSSFFTQMNLASSNPQFGDNVRLDSVCLQLGYLGRWGDSTTMLTANVYLLEEQLQDSATYYANSALKYNPDPIGTLSFLDNPNDSVTVITSVDTATYPPFLSIRLDDKFGQSLIDNGAEYSSNVEFVALYPGIRVAVEKISGDFGKMLYFNPRSAMSKIVLYYTNADISTSYAFPINDKCLRFNKFDIDHTNADPDFVRQLTSASPTSELGDQRLYLQPLSGARVRVNFDGLKRLKEMPNIVLNEVRLELYVDDYDEKLPPPSQLSLLTYSEGKTNWILDANPYVNPKGYFGGEFDKSRKGYMMRITRHIQQLLIDDSLDDTPIYLEIDGSALVANRAVLFGNNPNESEKRARIKIIYTIY